MNREAFMVDRWVIATEAGDKQAECFEHAWMDWFHSLWCMVNDESTHVSQGVDGFSRIRFFATLLGAIVHSNDTTEGRELQLAILEAAIISGRYVQMGRLIVLSRVLNGLCKIWCPPLWNFPQNLPV